MLSYLYCQSQSPTPSPAPTPVVPVTQYKAFWKAMNSLRNHSWHRWLKTEKLGLLLSPLLVVLDPGMLVIYIYLYLYYYLYIF